MDIEKLKEKILNAAKESIERGQFNIRYFEKDLEKILREEVKHDRTRTCS